MVSRISVSILICMGPLTSMPRPYVAGRPRRACWQCSLAAFAGRSHATRTPMEGDGDRDEGNDDANQESLIGPPRPAEPEPVDPPWQMEPEPIGPLYSTGSIDPPPTATGGSRRCHAASAHGSALRLLRSARPVRAVRSATPVADGTVADSRA